jgi:hypothetical protein
MPPTKVSDTVRSRSDHTTISPSLSGYQTQRIEARLLLVIQRIVEFRERRLKGLRRGEGREQPLLHCLDATRGRQRLVGRATDLELFRRLDGGVLQIIERVPLDRRRLHRLGDPINRQVADAARFLIAKLREIAREGYERSRLRNSCRLCAGPGWLPRAIKLRHCPGRIWGLLVAMRNKR